MQGSVIGVFTGRKGFWAHLPDAGIERLRADKRVLYIEADYVVTLADQGDTIQYTQPSTQALDRIDQRSGKLTLDNIYGWTANGSGVHIWIVDNGVDINHPELVGRVSSLAIGTNPLQSCTGSEHEFHGTRMAVAAAGSTQGIARGATIHSARVSNNGQCLTLNNSEAVQAIDLIRLYSPRPAIINYSANGTCGGGGCGYTVDNAMRRAFDAGVLAVVGAGNDSADACDRSPAHVPELLTVGASEAGTDRKYGYSGNGPCVDIFAPVVDGGGTSTATAYTTGVAALELQFFPNKSPSDVMDAIKNNASSGYLDPASLGTGSPNRLLYSRRPTLATDIAGGYWTMGPNTRCNWNALVVGGQPPYTFEWTRGNSTVSTSSIYASLAGGFSDFGLYLQVWDGVGRTATAAQWITIDPNNGQYHCGIPE